MDVGESTFVRNGDRMVETFTRVLEKLGLKVHQEVDEATEWKIIRETQELLTREMGKK